MRKLQAIGLFAFSGLLALQRLIIMSCTAFSVERLSRDDSSLLSLNSRSARTPGGGFWRAETIACLPGRGQYKACDDLLRARLQE